MFVYFQQVGLRELEHGSDLFTSIRGPLCSIILISYHTVVSYVLGRYITASNIYLFFILIYHNKISSRCCSKDNLL